MSTNQIEKQGNKLRKLEIIKLVVMIYDNI